MYAKIGNLNLIAGFISHLFYSMLFSFSFKCVKFMMIVRQEDNVNLMGSVTIKKMRVSSYDTVVFSLLEKYLTRCVNDGKFKEDIFVIETCST